MAKISRNLLRIEAVEMFCQYCTSFSSGRYNKYIKSNGDQIENSDELGEESVKKQFCARHKETGFLNLACDLFVLHPFFYCKKCNQTLDIIVCIARQKKQEIAECLKCSQGKFIKQYVESKEVCHENE